MPAPVSRTMAAAWVRRQLDETADALAQPDLARLLSSEMQLQSALAALANSCPVAGDQDSLSVELQRVRASLGRCRRLGAALTDFIQLSQSDRTVEPAMHTFQHSA